MTGGVGAGKTGLLLAAAEQLRREGLRPGGVVQPRVLEGDRVVAYRLRDVASGEERPFARPRHGAAPPRWDFEPAAWAWARERIARAAEEADVVFIDEIGRLEREGLGHAAAVRAVTARPLVLGVRDLALASVRGWFGEALVVLGAGEAPGTVAAALRGGS